MGNNTTEHAALTGMAGICIDRSAALSCHNQNDQRAARLGGAKEAAQAVMGFILSQTMEIKNGLNRMSAPCEALT